jgi:hypothetical protein
MTKPTKPTEQPVTSENEGEGSRTAARNYNQKTREFIDAGKVDEAAEAARDALDSDEREELADAEESAKSRARE